MDEDLGAEKILKLFYILLMKFKNDTADIGTLSSFLYWKIIIFKLNTKLNLY